MLNFTKNSIRNFIGLQLILLFISSNAIAQGKPGGQWTKASKNQGDELITNFKTRNETATIYGQTITKAQLDELVRTFPDCNAFSVYFGVDKTGQYSGENQYTIMIAPAVFNAENNSVKYVNDPGHDSSVYVPSMLCPDQCGLMQNQ
ncbi:MAG: hypothetical protein IPF81_08055 [Bacteroidetes bacterium]|nr:hypothetical protein [Bacteroidota bacterium]